MQSRAGGAYRRTGAGRPTRARRGADPGRSRRDAFGLRPPGPSPRSDDRRRVGDARRWFRQPGARRLPRHGLDRRPVRAAPNRIVDRRCASGGVDRRHRRTDRLSARGGTRHRVRRRGALHRRPRAVRARDQRRLRRDVPGGRRARGGAARCCSRGRSSLARSQLHRHVQPNWSPHLPARRARGAWPRRCSLTERWPRWRHREGRKRPWAHVLPGDHGRQLDRRDRAASWPSGWPTIQTPA